MIPSKFAHWDQDQKTNPHQLLNVHYHRIIIRRWLIFKIHQVINHSMAIDQIHHDDQYWEKDNASLQNVASVIRRQTLVIAPHLWGRIPKEITTPNTRESVNFLAIIAIQRRNYMKNVNYKMKSISAINVSRVHCHRVVISVRQQVVAEKIQIPPQVVQNQQLLRNPPIVTRRLTIFFQKLTYRKKIISAVTIVLEHWQVSFEVIRKRRSRN